MIANVAENELIRDKLYILCKKGLLSDKNVVIFGCTLYARNIRNILLENGININAIIDNNPEKVGKRCLGVLVWTPDSYVHENKQIRIIICSNYWYEMSRQLINLGLIENIDFFIIHIETYEHSDSVPTMFNAFKKISIGRNKYNYILKKYKDIEAIFLCPYPGTGDIYMACGFLPHYLKKYNIEKYVLVVVGKPAVNVANLFEIVNVENIDAICMAQLLNYYQFMDATKIIPLLYWGWRVKKYLFSDFYPSVTFTEMFRYDVFGLDNDTMPILPNYKGSLGYAEKLFQLYYLKQGKTVILAPYAGSFVSEITNTVWVLIVETLLSRGYCVCTNSCGSNEPVIPGSIPIFFPFSEAVGVLDYAGYFIGLRSGLCDIISPSICKMVVLYEHGFNATRYEYFSLKKMGLKLDAIEIIYELDDMESFVNKVCSTL